MNSRFTLSLMKQLDPKSMTLSKDFFGSRNRMLPDQSLDTATIFKKSYKIETYFSGFRSQ
jgi:hypothetical protein